MSGRGSVSTWKVESRSPRGASRWLTHGMRWGLPGFCDCWADLGWSGPCSAVRVRQESLCCEFANTLERGKQGTRPAQAGLVVYTLPNLSLYDVVYADS